MDVYTKAKCRKLTPLSCKALFTLKPGDKFRVYWAKDDSPRDIRFSFELRTVVSNNGQTIVTDDDDWEKNQCCGDDENVYNTSRGYAYFFNP